MQLKIELKPNLPLKPHQNSNTPERSSYMKKEKPQQYKLKPIGGNKINEKAVAKSTSSALELKAGAEKLELKASLRELEFIIRDIDKVTKQWDNKVGNFSGEVERSLRDLKEAHYILQKLPIKITEAFANSVTEISKEIGSRIFHDFEENLANCSNKLTKFIDRAEEVEELQRGKTRTILLGIVISLTVIVTISAFTSFSIMKYFPRHTHINGNEVTVQNSNVSVWGRAQIDKK